MKVQDRDLILSQFIDLISSELEMLRQAAKAAHESATHEEMQPEDSHDTQAIEASYLAKGQAERVTQLEALLREFSKYKSTPRHQPADAVQEGSLIQLQMDGKKQWSFYAKSGGGMKIQYQSQAIQILTSSSPVGEAIIDCQVGDSAEIEWRESEKEIQILAII